MKEKTFEEYLDENPRSCFPDSDMKNFLEFAKVMYLSEGGDAVNHCHCETEEEFMDEIENYIGDSMEAILLFKKYQMCKEAKKEGK